MLKALSATNDDRTKSGEQIKLATPQVDDSKWESAPLVGQDREIFFACRKAWLGDSDDLVNDVKEEDYDTTKTDATDVFPYLVTMGYRDEANRKEESLAQILRIKELRKKYNVPPLSEKPWTPDWEFSCTSYVEISRQWPLHESGTDGKGRLVLWDKSGNLDQEWTTSLMSNEEAKNAVTFYCIQQLENIARSKLTLSKSTGVRMTKHVSVMDAYNIGVTNVATVKDLMNQILGDVQVMFPETLKKLYIINSGWMFKAAWRVISKFIHPITAGKVVILGTNYRETLSEAGITEIPDWVK